jgi:hypothetical protein
MEVSGGDYATRISVTPQDKLWEITDASRQVTERFYEDEATGEHLWEELRNGEIVLFADRWTSARIRSSGGFGGCSLVTLSSCSAYAGEVHLADESTGIVSAIELSGSPTIVAPRWPIKQVVALVFTDMFYADLLRRDGLVDVRSVVAGVRQKMQSMSGVEAGLRLRAIATHCDDSRANLYLKVFARRLEKDERPFGNPWAWGCFAVAGTGLMQVKVSLKESGDHS